MQGIALQELHDGTELVLAANKTGYSRGISRPKSKSLPTTRILENITATFGANSG